MPYHELGCISPSRSLEEYDPTPQHIIPPDEFDAFADRWNDILSNPPPPTRPTRPSAPTPTPANEPVKQPKSVRKNKSKLNKQKDKVSRSSYQPQFDDKELDYKLHCLAQEKRLQDSPDSDEIFISKFDIFEEFQSYFLPNDNYVWIGNRRASKLCEEVTCGRSKRPHLSLKGVITDPQYLSFSSSTMYFGEGLSKPQLYSSRRFPTAEAYRPPVSSVSLSERSIPMTGSELGEIVHRRIN